MSKRSRPQLRDYKIAWICALQVEVDAARAVLDEEHDDIQEAANYILGRVGRHDVVIACPPAGQIGIGAAAITAERLRAVFPAIRYWLMVGIGGGVPSAEVDVRLGDVVISQPHGSFGGVVQYDLGKTGPGGHRLRTGSLNAPPQDLLVALTKLRSNINIGRSTLAACLSRLAATRYFARPSIETDVLFEATYKHSTDGDCTSCLREKIIPRDARSDTDIQVHCGLIASGNQVIKDGESRDSLSKELGGVLCFEMEAAGLMNSFPCLVIRGICDYADSHKNKKWQPFAAAAAASSAKEVLSCVSSSLLSSDSNELGMVLTVQQSADSALVATTVVEPTTESNEYVHATQVSLTNTTMSADERRRFFESLRFDQLESRHMSVKPALARTCEWVLQRTEFIDWLDSDKLKHHHGFLWVKGKAATGKSTIMKFMLSHIKKKKAASIITAFFFNARGAAIEKTTQGMYQSILYQLLEQYPALKSIFDLRLASFDDSGSLTWSIDVLQNLLRLAIERLGSRTWICLVDALDECKDDEVQDMVKLFSQLGKTAIDTGSQLRVLLSSRHYPYVHIDHGISLTLEDQTEHNEDIAEYLRVELQARTNPRIDRMRQEILERSSGIFLWVVLVVDILNKAYRRGQVHAMEERLKEVPNDIKALFDDILNRGTVCSEETVVCLQWVLYARRPLRVDELYCAVLAASGDYDTNSVEGEEVTVDDMKRFVLDQSRGLLEETKARSPTVQFIHESVREYLVSGEEHKHSPFISVRFRANRIHEKLTQVLYKYLLNVYHHCSDGGQLRDETWPKQFDPLLGASSQMLWLDWQARAKNFVLLEYATKYVLLHSDAAEQHGTSQEDFLADFNFGKWRYVMSLLSDASRRSMEHQYNILYALADQEVVQPMKIKLMEANCFDGMDERHVWLVLTGLATDCKHNYDRLVEWLASFSGVPSQLPQHLELPDVVVKQAMTLLREFRRSISKNMRDTPLLWAARTGQKAMTRLLLSCEFVDKHATDFKGRGAVELASLNKQIDILHLLVDAIEAPVNERQSWLSYYVNHGLDSCTRCLLDKYAEDIDLDEVAAWLPMIAQRGHVAVLKVLIEEYNLDVNRVDSKFRFALMEATRKGHCDVVKFLLTQDDINVNVIDASNQTPLLLAIRMRQLEAFKLLLERDDVNIQEFERYAPTPLSMAIDTGQVEFLETLLQRDDLEPNRLDRDGVGPLSRTVRMRNSEMCRALLDHGKIDVNLPDSDGVTPLLRAIRMNQVDVAQLLLQCKDIKVNGHSGTSAFLEAMDCGNLDIIRAFIDHKGTDVNLVDRTRSTPLISAVIRRRRDIVRILLTDKRVDVNRLTPPCRLDLASILQNFHSFVYDNILNFHRYCRKTGFSGNALHIAMSQGDHELTSLLSQRQDIQVYSGIQEADDFVFHQAVVHGSPIIVAKMLDHARFDVNSSAYSKNKPLIVAIQQGHVEVVRCLLQHKYVDPNIVGSHHKSPLFVAAAHHRIEISELLLNHPRISVSHHELDFIDKTYRSWSRDNQDQETMLQLLHSRLKL